MTKLETLLVATDLSARSMQAVDRAVALAARHRAHLTLIHALGLDALGPLRDLLGAQAPEVARRATQRQQTRLEAIAADAVARGAGTAEIHVEEGLAATVAKQRDAFLDGTLDIEEAVQIGNLMATLYITSPLGDRYGHIPPFETLQAVVKGGRSFATFEELTGALAAGGAERTSAT